jgi:adenylate cyclase
VGIRAGIRPSIGSSVEQAGVMVRAPWLRKAGHLAALLCGVLLAWGLGRSGLGIYLDHALYDHLLFQALPPVEDRRTVVVGIDDLALERFPEPLVLWHRYFAGLIDAAAGSGASAVGFDVIPSIALDTLAPHLDAELFRALRDAGRGGTPVILGYDAGEAGLLPHRKFRLAAAGLGFLNFWPDEDGVIRRYRTYLMDPKGQRRNLSLGLAVLPGQELENLGELPEELRVGYQNPLPPVYSLAEVFERRQQGDAAWLEERLRDKIVLVGITAPKLHDRHPAPRPEGGSGLLHGIFVHALALETLLAGQRIHSPGPAVMTALFLGIALLSSLLALRLSPLRAAGAIGLGVVAGYGMIHYAFGRLLWVPVSPLLAALLVPALLAGLVRYVEEYRQFRTLQRYFRSYVNTEVMREIIDHPERLGFQGSHVEATVMFTDIRDFTSLSEHLPPEQVVQGLNRYFSAMTGTVIEAGGYLNRYLGDGILAIFGAPAALPAQGAPAAVRSALRMREELARLNREALFPGVAELRIGIGLHTGAAIVGNIGCFEKMDYSIIGDTVNLASRIESKTKEYGVQILLSEATYGLVRDMVEVRRVGTAHVKGREQGVDLYELIAVKEEQS